MFRAQACWTRRESARTYIDDVDQLGEYEIAAVKIQSVWRGARERSEFELRQRRLKPFGYYTHTLGLTYATNLPKEVLLSKRGVYLLLEDPYSGALAQVISVLIVLTIVISIITFVLETVPEIYEKMPLLFTILEVVCTAIFTIEYGCRLAVCDQAGLTPTQFICSPMNVFDLLSILPFYVEVVLLLFGIGDAAALGVFRVVRLIRVLRMFKLGRYASGMRLMGKALQRSAQAMSVLLFLVCVGVTVFSSAVFTVERIYCPSRQDMSDEELSVYIKECKDVFNRGVSPSCGLCCNEDETPLDFDSIVAASWWSTVTMTSVGYGEVYPKTGLGKSVGVIAMLVGMVLIALPVAIVGQKFQDVYENNDLEEAKLRAAARMRVTGERWSLMPASDVCQRLKQLQLQDPDLATLVAEFTTSLEEVWEQREQLSRERKIELLKQDAIAERTDALLDNLEAYLPVPPPAPD